MPTGGLVSFEDFVNMTYPTATYTIDGSILDNLSVSNDIYQNGNIDRWTAPHLVSSNDLDDFAHRLFKIIKEHTPIDISEDEFMELIMNDR